MIKEPDDHWRLETYRNKLRHSLAARFLLRFHATLILAAAIVTGWLVDWTLLTQAHVTTIMVRYPLAIVAAYLAFLGGVAVWLGYSGIQEYLDARGVETLAGERVPVPRFQAGNGVEWLELGQLGTAAPEGCLWALGVVVVFFAIGGYVVMAAPSLFADVVLELLLAAGLLRGLRRAERSGWVRGVWANTWGSLVFSLATAFFIGLFALGVHPPATTLHELWSTMRHPGR